MQLFIMMGILLQLMQNKKLTAKQLAEHFEVSVRSVYRYIDNLSACGVPVCTKSGRDGGISLINVFTLDNLFFTNNELNLLKDNLKAPYSPKTYALLQKINYLLTQNQN